MSVQYYDKDTGTLTTLASGQRTWVGTKAAYEAEKQAGTLPNNCIIVITDDEVAMDTTPTEGSPVAVTSGGLYDKFAQTNDRIDYLMQKTESYYVNVDPIDNQTEANRLSGIKAFATIMKERYPNTHTSGVMMQIRYAGGYYSTVIFTHGANDECQVIEFDTNRDYYIRLFTGNNDLSNMRLIARYKHD